MKGIKIWVAINPKDSTDYEVSFIEPEYSGTLLIKDDTYTTWKEYVMFEVEYIGNDNN